MQAVRAISGTGPRNRIYTMKPIKYVVGDATDPQGSGRRIIAHVCNDAGGWGAGFVLALSMVDGEPEIAYRDWFENRGMLPIELDSRPPFQLGEVLFAAFKPDTFVCNMIAQRGTYQGAFDPIPLRYDALRHCLRRLGTAAHAAQASIHMPRIGCGLAGGEWKKVERIIQQEICAHNGEVTVYDLPQDRDVDAV